MKAFLIDHYKPVDGGRLADVADPNPGAGQVFAQVHAAGVNDAVGGDRHDDTPVGLDVHVTVDDLVVARHGAPLRLPSIPASARFARLFRFSPATIAVAG